MVAKNVNVVLVGAGTMSATLGVLLKQLNPLLTISIIERLDDVALESTSGWNNAGTGHAAYCELNYTPEQADGSVEVSKAYAINESFERTLQFWSYLVQQGALPEPSSFINPTPHLSFVWGERNVHFLRKRFEMLSQHPMFAGMEYSEDPAVLREWMPLVMNGRDPAQVVAGTRVKHGSDVNFGSLTRSMIGYLQQFDDVDIHLKHEVKSLRKQADGKWCVVTQETNSLFDTLTLTADFVFLGAGGGALPLLQKSGIAEGKGYGGFPVSGQWLVCKKPEIVSQHFAKVYGKASIGAPPMSVPHLDTRIIDGEKALLFGPFAGFTTKFLKEGSILDLLESIKPNNLLPMTKVGLSSFDLIRYLVSEVMQNHDSRMSALREYFPEARNEDWTLASAGQRVQIIKKDPVKGGKLEFGTEVITAADGSLAGLLGASPGASVTVTAMLQVLEKCFPKEMASDVWKSKLKTMIPSYGESLANNVALLQQTRAFTLSTLGLIKVDDYH
ncbi:malate dehydrogenase (quinone) [Thiothrix caldifontis]|uniref:Probable malate:quinone oxidoreductase n=1 Tax=Thiothrix caldifontis TaxID=525918 RepID=A0A1H4CK37_9GAMM|nr:malate dehydrogenase (quinone) [Thiothrix caldifontis]SEA60698.1 malate dehydrogenase (quinone) [Thiothrix caldifontis]